MTELSSVASAALTALACVANDVLIKVVSSVEIDGEAFQRPFVISFFIFIGMSLVWFLERPWPHARVFVMLLGPAVLQTASVLMFNCAVVFGQASVCFVIRHSLLMFMPIAMLGRRPRGYQILAIGIVVLATAFGFFAHLPDWHIPLLVVAAQLLKAGQMAVEKRMLEEVEISDCLGISAEAAWSTLLCLFIAFPVAAIIPGSDESAIPGGSVENVRASFGLIFSSAKLAVGVLIVVFMAFLSAGTGLMITGNRAKVTFVVVGLVVSLVAWAVLLAIGKSVGEIVSWNSLWQLLSFVLFVVASLVYHQVIRFPCFTYSEWAHLSDQDVPMELMDQ